MEGLNNTNEALNTIEQGQHTHTGALDITLPREFEDVEKFCIDCDLRGIEYTAHAGHHHHTPAPETDKDKKPELEVGNKVKIGNFKRFEYVISGTGWAMVAALLFMLDNATFHVLDFLLLDFVYVAAGIVAFLEYRAAWRGYVAGPMTYTDVYNKVKGHFNVYKDWLLDRIGYKKKVQTPAAS